MIQFAASMFPNAIVIRKADCIESEQGGSNPYPEPSAGRPYMASVQPASGRVVTSPAAYGEIDQTKTKYNVFLPKVESDTFLPTLIRGDQIESDGLVLSILGPPQNRGGYNVLLRLECEQVN